MSTISKTSAEGDECRSPRPVLRPYQAAIGLTLGLTVMSGWIGVHLGSVFLFPLSWQTAPFVPLVIALQCWLTVGLFIVAHDAMHGSLAPGWHRLNGAVGTFILTIYAGFGWRRVRDAHMAHHDAPGTAADPDFFIDEPDRFWPWFRTFFMRYFGLRSVLFVCTVVTTYIFVFGASVFNVVLFYGLPSLLSSLQLFYFGTFLPHRHEESGFSDRHNARSNELGYFASLVSCFHFGYHHEHHSRPWVPWWALPDQRQQALKL